MIFQIKFPSLFSCSSNNDNIESETLDFAMTAMINGELFEANNPFGDNKFSETNIFGRYPIEDFVLLQARMGGAFGGKEIKALFGRCHYHFHRWTGRIASG